MESKGGSSSYKSIASSLPEDFFDSQTKGKKAKEDDLARELEQFEKDMAALEAESEEQLKEEFEKLQDEKNIDELDQQLEQWKRIVDLEARAEELQNKTLSEKQPKRFKSDIEHKEDSGLKQVFNSARLAETEVDDDDNLSDIEYFEDKLSNWRSKGL